MDHHKKNKFFLELRHYFWDDPFLFRVCIDQIIRCCVSHEEGRKILFHCHSGLTRSHYSANRTSQKVLEVGFNWPSVFRDAHDFVVACDRCQITGNISKWDEMPQKFILECKVFDV